MFKVKNHFKHNDISVLRLIRIEIYKKVEYPEWRKQQINRLKKLKEKNNVL